MKSPIRRHQQQLRAQGDDDANDDDDEEVGESMMTSKVELVAREGSQILLR